MDRLKGFNWLNFHDGGKFSTSGKRGIFAGRRTLDIATDYWR